MNIEDKILKKKQKAYKDYCSEMKKWNSKENQIRFLLMNTLKERVKSFFKDCTVWGCDSLYFFDQYIGLSLTKDYNLSHDYNLFLEANEPLIALVCGGSEFKTKHKQEDKCFEYIYPKFRIDVYYGSGRCRMVKIAEKTKTIKEPIYEVVCK
jgi:hypothetical protein